MDDYLFNPDHSWFKHLFESSPDPAWIIYGNRFVECNDAAISILGYSSREELLNVHPSKLSPARQPDGEDSFAKAERMMAIAKDKGLHRFEWTHIKADNSDFDAEVTLSVFELQDRQIIYCVWRDITERKRSERRRQAHTRSLENMERVNKAILTATDIEQMMGDVLDVVLSIFDCDRAFLMYPCDPDAVEWRLPMERTRPEYPRAIPIDKEIAGVIRITLNSDGPVTFGPGAEYPIPPKVMEQFSIQSQMLMALYPKLEKPWQFGIHQCSHAKVWTKDEAALFQKIGWRLSDALTSLLMYRNLRASEQEFRTLAENIPLVLVRYDREGRRTYVNPSAESDFGAQAEQMVGKTLQETNPISMAETYQRALEHTLATGERSEFELDVPLVSGNVRTGIILIAAEFAADGKICGAISIGRDITALKQAKNQLRKLNTHLLSVREEEKAHLAREIHDDLGSALAALKIEAHFMRRELSADQKTIPLVTRVESILQLLDSTIASTRRITTNLRPTVLDTLGLLSALQWQADQFQNHTGIECRVDCISRTDYDCANSCNGCEDRLDEPLSINLFRICQEALTNAARHSGASKVKIEFQPCHHEIALSISDNGRGFPEGHKIAPTSFGIRGMRERVEQLGGKISFDSQIGGGVSMLVKLPLPADIRENA